MNKNFTISGFSDEISPDIDQQFETLNKLGIEYFEVRGVNGKNIADLNDEELNSLKNKMAEKNIKASSIGSPIGKIKITDDFAPHFETFKRVCHIAKFLGTKYIRIFSFFVSADKLDEYRSEVLSRLLTMIDYAREQDLILLHENEKDIYGESDDRCLDLMKNLYSDNFKAVFDPANFVQAKVDTKRAYSLLKDYIEYMHIKDATSDASVVPAGKGLGNIPYILSDLKERGYVGFLSLEPHLGAFVGLSDIDDTAEDTVSQEASDATKFALAHSTLVKIIESI